MCGLWSGLVVLQCAASRLCRKRGAVGQPHSMANNKKKALKSKEGGEGSEPAANGDESSDSGRTGTNTAADAGDSRQSAKTKQKMKLKINQLRCHLKKRKR